MARLGNIIRDKRRERGLFQGDLADDLCMTDLYIARIEVGEIIPSSKKLYTISDVLQIPFDELTYLSRKEKKYRRVKLSDELDKQFCALPLKYKRELLEFAWEQEML